MNPVNLFLTPWFALWAGILTHQEASPEGAKDIGKPVGEAYRKKWNPEEKH
jgi:hypothetical protein